MRAALFCALCALAGGPATTVAAASTKKTPSSSTTPCAAVSASIADQIDNASDEDYILVPAGDALECLASVPVISKAEAAALIDEIKLYLSWQSNVAYYSNPPADFKGEQADVSARLNEIAATAAKGKYANEYELQRDLSLALTQTYDFHLAYTPDILGQFLFYRGKPGELALVSLSADGQAVPKLYNYCEFGGVTIWGGCALTECIND
jgi:hypothetical protein